MKSLLCGILLAASFPLHRWRIGNTFYKEKTGKANRAIKVTVAPIFYDDTKGAVISVNL